MQQDAPLPWSTRSMIVLIALLQGLALYAAQELAPHWPFHDLACRYSWNAWVLTVPSAIALTLGHLRDRRLWLHALLASLLVIALAAWVGWNLAGVENIWVASLRDPLSISLAIATFVLLPWWQFRLQHGHWRADYPALFERAWQNGLILLVAAVFTGLAWMLLWLWAALFSVVKVDFFHHLFRERAFVALATGTLAGFGVLIGRTQHRAIQIIRQVLFALCRGLLPLLSFIAVLFVISLPLTGLASPGGYRSQAQELLTLAVLLVCMVNAVYQRSGIERPYPTMLRRVVEASLLVLPVYTGVALYSLALRIGQYGWTIERFWGVGVGVLTAGYAAGYALAVVRRSERWLQGIEPVNRVMCWAVLALAVLGNTPLLDPARIAARSLAERVRADPSALTVNDSRQLRQYNGRPGVDALRALQQDPVIQADRRATAIIAQQMKGEPGASYTLEDYVEAGVYDLLTLKQRITLAKGSASPPDTWWTSVLEHMDASDCVKEDNGCIALQRDLDGDGQQEVLLCKEGRSRGPECALHVWQDAQWREAAEVNFREDDGKAANQALRDGQLRIAPSRWPDLSLGDQPADIHHSHDFGRMKEKQ
ncbi:MULTISPECIES: DUF7057 domain-containing protein [Stenotrophomonas]|uniref:DUF4153 domain-containing protein n=1 Tax=Stenotrophomonas lactitubi TaxID=2045214 RepID=A0AAW4GL62_9GAMM|nr:MULTISPECIES: DUF4153 domain-containing protein [Stenotrophomonas]MBM9915324.1 DUF4153 domain-containing protein [Stenotrophomonas lactitubi]MBM9922189.1 DUF4153 domain-containing protein [Stenotrophomonas lactitubi]MBM9939840.1 DUF4153 domain-containing protein [Stenotrophomonas lactitubi]